MWRREKNRSRSQKVTWKEEVVLPERGAKALGIRGVQNKSETRGKVKEHK